MEEFKGNKRFRDDSEEPESGVDSPAVKRLRENLLDSIDDDVEFCTTSQDLDTFMKSFEEEITNSPSTAAAEVVNLTSESSESRPELGYLLEASDDELGLPPTASSTLSGVRSELVRVESESSYLGGEFWEAQNFEAFGFGFEETETFNGVNGEFLAPDGLFDDSDLGFRPNAFSWRPETLPAQ